MGTFMGHFIPGTFFIIMALWWTFASLARYYRVLQRKNGRYKSTVSFTCTCCGGRTLPIESVLKIVFVGIGITGELVTGMENGHFKFIGNAQHATMYAMFGFSGVVDLLVHFRAPLPPNIDYAWSVLAFVSEALLFEFHLHLHMPLVMAMHKLLYYTVLATIVAICVEMRWQHNVLSTLARSYFVFLQGTWFLQIGADLYLVPGSTKHHDKPAMGTHMAGAHVDRDRAIEASAIKFSWHMFGVFAFMTLMAVTLSCCLQPRTTSDSDIHFFPAPTEDESIRLTSAPNGALLVDSEEDEAP